MCEMFEIQTFFVTRVLTYLSDMSLLIDPFEFLGDLSVRAELSAENVQNLANGPGRSRAM